MTSVPVIIEPQEALQIVMSHVRVLKARPTALGAALNCCLAEDVRNDRDQPPADRSAMDGYAVIAADLRQAPATLRLVGEVSAGSLARPCVRPGTCAVVLTGGNVPPGADAVVPLERTECLEDRVVFHASAKPGDDIRKRGEEAARGDVLLPKGTMLGPAEVGVCAMVGKAEVKVRPRPKVAVFSTGAEVRAAAERVGVHQIRDSNGPALLAALGDGGFGGAAGRLIPDDPRAIAGRLKRALRTRDVVILTGGVSVGRYDYVPEAVQRAGGTIRFHGVKMKPGRPVLYATLPWNRHVFALPGNPVSMLTGYYELALPALRKLCGVSAEACRTVMKLRLSQPARSKGNRTYYALARIIQTEYGPAVLPVKSKGSADIIGASKADGVIVIPDGIKELPAGVVVEFHRWKRAL